MKKTELSVRVRSAALRHLEPIINAGILAALVITVLVISLLLSSLQLSGAQSPLGFAQAMAESQTITAQTAPGYLTTVLLLVGVLAFWIVGAYYTVVRKPPE